MGRGLFVTSSVFGAASQSRSMAAELIGGLRREQPRVIVTERALDPEGMPHVSGALIVGS